MSGNVVDGVQVPDRCCNDTDNLEKHNASLAIAQQHPHAMLLPMVNQDMSGPPEYLVIV